MRFGVILHGFGDLRIELANRLLGLLNLIGQELDRHRCRCNQGVIAGQELSRTNAVNNLIQLPFIADGVVTQNTADQPPISTTKLAWVGPAPNDTQEQRKLPFLAKQFQSEGKIGL